MVGFVTAVKSLGRLLKVATGFFLTLLASALTWWVVHRTRDATDREVLTIAAIAAVGLAIIWTDWRKR